MSRSAPIASHGRHGAGDGFGDIARCWAGTAGLPSGPAVTAPQNVSGGSGNSVMAPSSGPLRTSFWAFPHSPGKQRKSLVFQGFAFLTMTHARFLGNSGPATSNSGDYSTLKSKVASARFFDRLFRHGDAPCRHGWIDCRLSLSYTKRAHCSLLKGVDHAP